MGREDDLKAAHVHTVECPSCRRAWTGQFFSPVPEKAVCKDCIANGEGTSKGHRDIHINPRQEQ